jgi:hypothetical protein
MRSATPLALGLDPAAQCGLRRVISSLRWSFCFFMRAISRSLAPGAALGSLHGLGQGLVLPAKLLQVTGETHESSSLVVEACRAKWTTVSSFCHASGRHGSHARRFRRRSAGAPNARQRGAVAQDCVGPGGEGLAVGVARGAGARGGGRARGPPLRRAQQEVRGRVARAAARGRSSGSPASGGGRREVGQARAALDQGQRAAGAKRRAASANPRPRGAWHHHGRGRGRGSRARRRGGAVVVGRVEEDVVEARARRARRGAPRRPR